MREYRIELNDMLYGPSSQRHNEKSSYQSSVDKLKETDQLEPSFDFRKQQTTL